MADSGPSRPDSCMILVGAQGAAHCLNGLSVSGNYRRGGLVHDMNDSTTTAEKAGFLVRLVAAFIDGIILVVVNLLITVVFNQQVAGLLTFIVGIGYYVYFWSTSGSTPGKQAMGLRVVSTDGSIPTASKAFLRYVGYIISAIPFFLGFIWIAFDPQKQGWHDKIAGTYVVKR